MTLDKRLFDAAGRVLLAAVLIAAATLKLSSDPAVGSRALACLEYAMAAGLLVSPARVNMLALHSLGLFLVASAGLGVWRASGKEGLAGSCECLGNRVPLATWQQLVLTAVMLSVLGVVFFVRPDRDGNGPRS